MVQLTRIPGVESVALATALPVERGSEWKFEQEDKPRADANDASTASGIIVSPGYFETLGRRVITGRDFTDEDGRPGHTVAIVNQRFAEKYWPGTNPLGKRLRIVGDTEEPWLEVVGLVPNIKQTDPDDQEIAPILYVPFRQQASRGTVVLLRTSVDPRSVITAARREFQTLDSELPVFGIMTLADSLALERSSFSIFGMLFIIFGVVALIVASVGVYAVIAYWVNQQTREIGIRIALGEAQSSILRRVTTKGLKLAAIGLAIGALGSIAVTRVMRSMLVGVSPTDPATFLAVGVLLTAVAALACYIPARRAAHVDPMIALRSE
jgi:predicted permease